MDNVVSKNYEHHFNVTFVNFFGLWNIYLHAYKFYLFPPPPPHKPNHPYYVIDEI